MKHAVGLLGLAMALAGCVSPQPTSQAKTEWVCPDGFTPHEGLNTGFTSDGLQRAFVIVPAKGIAGAAPVWDRPTPISTSRARAPMR